MEKRIICVATPLYAPDIGGPATHVALLEGGLSREEFELRIVKFTSVASLPKGLRHFVYFCKVWNAARGADFVYALDPVSVGLPALMAAKVAGKKFVLRVGGDYAWEQGTQRFDVTETLDEFVKTKQPSREVRRMQFVQSYVARHAVVVIAPSNYLAGVIRMWGIPAKRIQVIYSQPEIKSAQTSRSEARKRLNIREDEEIIISAGRLVPWKGFKGLVDATIQLQGDRRVRLVIAGDGPQLEALKKYIADKEASGVVTLLGNLPHAELSTWFAAADVFVLNTQYEGLSHTVLEAFAVRTPVITTPVGGNTELVEDGKTGLLVAPGNTSALSAAIIRVLTDRSFAHELAEQAHMSLSRFTLEIAIEKLGSLFKSI